MKNEEFAAAPQNSAFSSSLFSGCQSVLRMPACSHDSFEFFKRDNISIIKVQQLKKRARMGLRDGKKSGSKFFILHSSFFI
ncbi:MAG: hypothetical protein IJ618_11235 [Prevotella sp.]|nr:hypothetical protein [Prevotella sp.]